MAKKTKSKLTASRKLGCTQGGSAFQSAAPIADSKQPQYNGLEAQILLEQLRACTEKKDKTLPKHLVRALNEYSKPDTKKKRRLRTDKMRPIFEEKANARHFDFGMYEAHLSSTGNMSYGHHGTWRVSTVRRLIDGQPVKVIDHGVEMEPAKIAVEVLQTLDDKDSPLMAQLVARQLAAVLNNLLESPSHLSVQYHVGQALIAGQLAERMRIAKVEYQGLTAKRGRPGRVKGGRRTGKPKLLEERRQAVQSIFADQRKKGLTVDFVSACHQRAHQEIQNESPGLTNANDFKVAVDSRAKHLREVLSELKPGKRKHSALPQ